VKLAFPLKLRRVAGLVISVKEGHPADDPLLHQRTAKG
jgi:hypothetical protein